MLDMKFIREHAEEVKENLVNRHNPFDLDHVLDLDQKRRELLQQTEVLKSQKNAAGTTWEPLHAAASLTSSPAHTRVSLLARATRLRASMAARVA